MSTSELHYIVR